MSAVIDAIFLNPKSIFFPPFLVSGIVITLVWLRVSQRIDLKQSLAQLFSPRVWLTRQAALDLVCSIVMLVVFLKVTVKLESYVFKTVGPSQSGSGSFAEAVLATVTTMLAYDFASYAMHRLMHHWPWLWRVHSFHHSAPSLNFFTTYRQHPIEPVLLALARSFAAASSLAVLHFVFSVHTQVITIYGLGAGFFLYMFTVNLHHSPVPVSYPRLVRKVLISPHVHHLHHSCADHHQGINYGVVFSIWDHLFGTYLDETCVRNPKFQVEFLWNHRT
jgi:sterol desaturase/sphingolipid hydroxylase (fatty acid hydroxylase superfamily)